MPDLPYDEAMRKKQEEDAEAIKKINGALETTGRVARFAAKYYVECVAESGNHDLCLELTKQYAALVNERAM